MSRHRNIRSMNYSEEYDGYDDVYGHSLDDEYCISPSDAAFIYNREGSRESQKISAFLKSDEDIAEEDETADRVANLDDIEKAQLNSSIEKVKSILGDSKISEQDLIYLTLKHNFEVEKVIDVILTSNRLIQENKPEPPKEKDLSINSKIHIPKLFDSGNMFTNKKFEVPNLFSDNLDTSLSSLVSNHLKITPEIPKLFENTGKLFENQSETPKMENTSNILENINNSSSHASLSSLVSSHLKSKPEVPKLFDNKLAETPKMFTDLQTNQSPNKKSENYIDNDWHIDLTSALCNSKTAPLSKTKVVDNGEFLPLFVECSPQKTKKVLTDFCKMDISDLFFVNNILEKNVSNFGKIITKRFIFRKPFEIYERKYKSKFGFDCPSPDDIVLTHSGRK